MFCIQYIHTTSTFCTNAIISHWAIYYNISRSLLASSLLTVCHLLHHLYQHLLSYRYNNTNFITIFGFLATVQCHISAIEQRIQKCKNISMFYLYLSIFSKKLCYSRRVQKSPFQPYPNYVHIHENLFLEVNNIQFTINDFSSNGAVMLPYLLKLIF